MKIISAIIGTGVGTKHLQAIENYKGSKVKIICEKDKKKMLLLRKKYPHKIISQNENIIFNDKEINLVSIASYDNFHFSQIKKSIENNKNIIVEKPMCLTSKELKKIKVLIKNSKNKVNITSNLVLRVNSLFKKIKSKIDINKVYYIEGDYIWGRKKKLFGWRSKIKDYTVTLGAGIHIIDLIMWLTGKRPISVYAVGNKISTNGTKFKRESLIVMIFKFPGDLIAKITANAGAVYDHFHELKVFSLDKTLVNSRLGSFGYEKNKFVKIKGLYPDKLNRKKLIRDFIDSLKEKKKKHMISFREQLDLMSVCFAVEKALKKKKQVKINYI